MQTYIDKLEEIGIEALEENKDEIKKAIKESQVEIIRKAPQHVEKLIDVLSDAISDVEGE